MADQKNKSVPVDAEPEVMQEGYAHQNRRYVGSKETIAYVVYDMSQSFNIGKFDERFITSILQISFNLQTLTKAINGVWDIINDIFTGAIVDKTRTRWGKFKPYLMVLAIPGTILSLCYWIMPLLFPGQAPDHMGKFIMYLLLALIREGVGTFQGIAQLGIQATITPHPVDRTRLITVANFVSGFVGEKLPEQIMTILLDLVGNGVIKLDYTKLFVGMGSVTVIIAGAGAFWFFSICKERVMQSIEEPSIIQGIKSIINNKPLLLITLSEMLNGFSIGGSKTDYLIDVLNFGSLAFITGIPGSIVHPFSYALVPWFRRHFSSRTLYIIATYIGNLLNIPVFFFGSLGGKKNGMYKRVVPMGLALTLWETVFMFFYGVRTVIPSEMFNECMDYCEWKNGYRSEAMTSVAKGLAKKLTGIVSGVISTQIKKLIGYDLTAYTRGTAQSDDTKFGLFAMFTIIPFVTSSLGIIPILFYDLNGKKRDKMYEELLARRSAVNTAVASGDAEAMELAAKAQKLVGNENDLK